MNAVEIEEAVSGLAASPFDAAEFPYSFLEAFGNKPTTIKKLRSAKNSSNSSDIPGGVLQRNNIHMAVCAPGATDSTLTQLGDSPRTAKGKVKIILATDGIDLVAEDLASGDMVACPLNKLADHFGFFLSLAGISTTKEIRNNPVDIKATGRLNRLYVELLKQNREWDTDRRRHDMNQFMARLIFCYFAEDTGIFPKDDLFTDTVETMSDNHSGNTDFVIANIFRAMNIQREDRDQQDLPNWTRDFPYVNGALFANNREVPKFSRLARRYLIYAGKLNWKQINPDIFGSMIQAVAEDEERGAIGMHYTSVPNILKVLNPLFLDDLKATLEAAGDNPRKLLNLRKRIANIRVFDPACGSGNFLVIAYKEMRAIEADINRRRNETHLKSHISLRNFRGIELREFAVEIARLALIVAEYQCDELYRGQKDALADFLPLDDQNWIVHGNALRLDWLSICPPAGKTVDHYSDDLLHELYDQQTPLDFETEGGETYLCGNPPYKGSSWQSKDQKSDLESVFGGLIKDWRSLDYVAGWFMKAAQYNVQTHAVSAFVATNSICQGWHIPILWPPILDLGNQIAFARTSFKWANLASHNAGVTVVIVGFSNQKRAEKRLYSETPNGKSSDEESDIQITNTPSINAYLIAADNIIVSKQLQPISQLSDMKFGNKPTDGGHLLLSRTELQQFGLTPGQSARLIRKYIGAADLIRGLSRYCLWIENSNLEYALKIPAVAARIEAVRAMRLASRTKSTNDAASRPHQFKQMSTPRYAKDHTIVVPRVSSETRAFLPVDVVKGDTIISDTNFALYDAPLWQLALLASRLHWTWAGTVCGRLEMRFFYSNTLGWNTFPLPTLTTNNKADLTRCAEDILLAREVHFPATIADLYKPGQMPENLARAHENNDDTLERIYIGRRFKNDTERLEKLFELYTAMITKTHNKATAL